MKIHLFKLLLVFALFYNAAHIVAMESGQAISIEAVIPDDQNFRDYFKTLYENCVSTLNKAFNNRIKIVDKASAGSIALLFTYKGGRSIHWYDLSKQGAGARKQIVFSFELDGYSDMLMDLSSEKPILMKETDNWNLIDAYFVLKYIDKETPPNVSFDQLIALLHSYER